MLTYGTDPEFFAFRDKKLVTADKLFPGKYEPYKFDDGQAVFFDGVQGEFNVNPASTAAQLHANIIAAVNSIKENFDVDEIKFVSTVEVDLEAIKDADPECNRFGCDTDYNAYTMSENENEIDASEHPYRYAGGHFHIGNLPEDIMGDPDKIIALIKMCDVFMGIPSVIRDHSEETKIRRSYQYGKAGSFRVQPHGIEYRPLSNYWVTSKECTEELVRGAEQAVKMVTEDKASTIIGMFGEDEIQHIINKIDVDRANAFIQELRDEGYWY